MPLQHRSLKIGVAGASGYAGRELLRILSAHPCVGEVLAAAGTQAGQALTEVHPDLCGLVSGTFLDMHDLLRETLDVLFLALPHGEAKKLIAALPHSLRVVDLSQDFRHAPGEFIYGIPELQREALKGATRVASAGCFATAVQLALAPLVAADAIQGAVFVDGKTGSTGAGNKPLATTHHPERAEDIFAYKPLQHQHHAEIVAGLGGKTSIVFQAHATPLTRGVYVTAFAALNHPVRRVAQIFADFYAASPFVRLLAEGQMPHSVHVRGTHRCDIGWAVNDQHVVVCAAIDNLLKGAASQAVQNWNLMMGFDETLGLTGLKA